MQVLTPTLLYLKSAFCILLLHQDSVRLFLTVVSVVSALTAEITGADPMDKVDKVLSIVFK